MYWTAAADHVGRASESPHRRRRRSTSSSARSSTTSARRSPCCCSPASMCSASPGCGSPRRRSSSRLWRRPWRALRGAGPRRPAPAPRLGRGARGVMNACFYLAIGRLPLGTVAAIEFLPVIALAALGARSARNVAGAGAGRRRRVPPHRRAARRPAARPRVRLRQRRALRRLHRARRPRRQAAAAERHRRPRRGDADRRGRGHAARRLAGGAAHWSTRSPCWPASESASPPRSSPTSPTSSRWPAFRGRPTR